MHQSMKKANVYLLAYIVFLFICLIMKQISAFPTWIKIVVATTNSSFFFAIADGFQFFADSWENLYRENDKNIRYVQENIFAIRSTWPETKSEANSRTLNRLENSIKEISAENLKVSRSVFRLRCTAQIFIGFGFLIFLCILVFTEAFDYLFPRQEVVTVCGFLLVLIVQFLRPILQEISRETLKKIEVKVDKLVEAMNQLFEEEPPHAD